VPVTMVGVREVSGDGLVLILCHLTGRCVMAILDF